MSSEEKTTVRLGVVVETVRTTGKGIKWAKDSPSAPHKRGLGSRKVSLVPSKSHFMKVDFVVLL